MIGQFCRDFENGDRLLSSQTLFCGFLLINFSIYRPTRKVHPSRMHWVVAYNKNLQEEIGNDQHQKTVQSCDQNFVIGVPAAKALARRPMKAACSSRDISCWLLSFFFVRAFPVPCY